MVNRRKFRITARLMALLTLFTAACGAAPEAEVTFRLVWHGTELAPDVCFGDVTAMPDDNLLVEVDGKQVKDFTVTSAEPEVMRVERTADGRICLTKLRSFGGRNIEFTVTYAGKDYTYACNDDGLAALSLIWHGNEIAPKMCFGDVTAVPDDNLLVEVDGEIVTDFTVASAEPEVMRVERTADGRICLTKLQGFNGRNIEFTVTYGGKDYSFRCNDDGLPMEAQPQGNQNAAEEAVGFASFEAVEQMASENHAPYTNGNAQESMNIDRYAISDKALLTQTEMDELRTEKEKADHISIEQAKEDVDLFFRAWKYSYPSYYFMGEDMFLAAKEQALAELEAYPDGLSGAQMGDILYEAMSFLQDDHSSVDGKAPASVEDLLYYVSYLDNAQTFDKDEAGYYQIYEGEKWYFASADHAELRIEPTLFPSGKVVYCPMLLVPKSEAVHENQMVLVKDGEKKNITLCWTVSEDVSYTSKIDTQCKTQVSGDIYYINYLDMHSNNGDVNDFLKTAEEAKNYKAVIFDLRHTLGHEHWQFVEWLEIFTGKTVNVSSAFLTRNNALRTLRNYRGFKAVSAGYEDCSVWYEKGKQTDNDIPIIILADKSVLSSIEESLLYLKTLGNTIVIGSNTRGCSQGGSVQTYYLSNSGVTFAIGGFMKFQGEVKNIDGIGYEPDVWCNPAEAFSNALMFLQNYGIVGEESAQPLYLQSLPPADLRLVWGQEILPGQVFGCISDWGDIVYVTVDGQQVYDFTVRSEAPETMTAEPTDDGKICLTKQKSFEGAHVGLIITYQGKDYQFYCND